MTNADQIRVGLIGCGYQGQWLAKAVAQVEGLTLTGFVDPDADAAAKVSDISGGAGNYSSPEALINSDQVDANAVSTCI
jgi:predicted dehydrogenase